MFKIVKLSGKCYAKEIDLFEDSDLDDINQHVNECEPVLLVDSLEDAEIFGINPDEINIV